MVLWIISQICIWGMLMLHIPLCMQMDTLQTGHQAKIQWTKVNLSGVSLWSVADSVRLLVHFFSGLLISKLTSLFCSEQRRLSHRTDGNSFSRVVQSQRAAEQLQKQPMTSSIALGCFWLQHTGQTCQVPTFHSSCHSTWFRHTPPVLIMKMSIVT